MSAHHGWCLGMVMLLVGMIASGCSTQARWVDCDGQLEPINRPAPKVKDSLSREPTSPDSKKRTQR